MLHRKLKAWQQSIDLAKQVYAVTAGFPIEERYGLRSQMCRAAVSVGSNIAEGAARQTKKEFINFLHIASGSLSELDTQLEIAIQVGLANAASVASAQSNIEGTKRLVYGLIKSLKERERRQ